jgi:hypothetical protein
LNPRPHEAQLEDQKAKKSSRRSSRRRKPQKATKWTKIGKAKQNDKEELRKAQNQSKSSKSTLRLTLSMQDLPLRQSFIIYHVSFLIHPISKSSTNFMPILSPFGNELIKHKPREELDAMHEI